MCRASEAMHPMQNEPKVSDGMLRAVADVLFLGPDAWKQVVTARIKAWGKVVGDDAPQEAM